MESTLHISSAQNPNFKRWLKLMEKSRSRKAEGLFWVEGQREISMALQAGYQPEAFISVPEWEGRKYALQLGSSPRYTLHPDLYAKLAYRESTEGVLALMKARSHALDGLNLPDNPLVLVAEGIEKPGNMGALLRTADAVGADAVLFADTRCDVYNPNVIRASMGCVFTVPMAVSSSIEVLAFLQAHHIQVFAATLQNANPYTQRDFCSPTALVVGAEDNGLTTVWRSPDIASVYIPMQGHIDSMNVSVAAAVLLFEARRQRDLCV